MLCAGRGLNCGKTRLGCCTTNCASLRVAPHPQLSGKTSDIHCAPSTLFSGLSPSRLFPLSKLKNTLKGRRFQTTEEIQENAIRELRAITESAFQKHFNNGRNVGNSVSPVEGTTLKGTALKIL